MTTAVKTERITILGTPDFKNFLKREAKKEGVSLSQLIRQRCEKKAQASGEQELLKALLKEVCLSTTKAEKSLEQGLGDVEQAIAEIRARQ